MLESILEIDSKLFLILNSYHNNFFDSIMLGLSYSKVLMFFILSIITLFGYKFFKKKFLIIFTLAILSVGSSDLISSKIVKPSFERLRPCHNELLANKVYLAGENCWGGKFGFYSSHASNSFTLATIFVLFFRKKSKYFYILFLYAGLVAYSRIYLAKHYPLDIIFGALAGVLVALFWYQLFKLIHKNDRISGPF